MTLADHKWSAACQAVMTNHPRGMPEWELTRSGAEHGSDRIGDSGFSTEVSVTATNCHASMQTMMDGAWMASEVPVVHQGAVGNFSP